MERKRNGYTLVEIIVSLVILVAIVLVVGFGLNRVFSKQGDTDYEAYRAKVISAADVYMSNNNYLLRELESNRGFIRLDVKTLKQEGLIESDLTNPETGEVIGDDEIVLVSFDATGAVKFTYPSTGTEEYLQTLNKVVNIGEEFDCLDGLDTVNLGLIKTDGYLYENYFKDGHGTITCLTEKLDTNELGTYPVKYNYTTTAGVTKEAIRNYVVWDSVPPKMGDFYTSASTKGAEDWYINLTRSIDVTDEESGIGKVEYCISGNVTCNPTTRYPVSNAPKELKVNVPFPNAAGNQYLCVKVTDAANNETLKCDTGFKVDGTIPIELSIKFGALREWNISAKDNESNIAKLECKYGTSASALNQTVVGSGNKCVLPRNAFAAGTTYYVKLVATNRAGLVTESAVISGKWIYTIADAYMDDCSSNGEIKTFCTGGSFNPLYVKYGKRTFVVYNAKQTNGITSYRAILNGVYQQTAYWVSSCDGSYLVSQNFAQIYNSTLNSSFLNNELPTNYKTHLNIASWCIGTYNQSNDGCKEKTTAYVGLLSYPDYATVRTNNRFREGTEYHYYWLSNYGSIYIPVEIVKVDESFVADPDDEDAKPPVTITIVQQLNYSFYMAYGYNNTANLLPTHSTGAWARPVIEFKKSAVICSGNGKSAATAYVIGTC